MTIDPETISITLSAKRVQPFDVVVAGGGPAGVMAAVAAARSGARVALLERLGGLGGNLTAGLVNPMLTFHAASGLQVVRGLAQEMVDRLIEVGGSIGHVPDPVAFVRTVTPFDPDRLKVVLDDLVSEVGIVVYFHTQVFEVVKEGDRITHVVAIAGKEGPIAFEADIYIDATGDGDVSAHAGEAWRIGREGDGMTQPMTMMFHVAGVDRERLRAHVSRHPDDFYAGGEGLASSGGYVGVSGFFEVVRTAVARGELPPTRDRILFFGGVAPDEVVVNVTRVAGATVLDARAWSHAEMEGRRQVWAYARFLRKYIPGFEQSRVVRVGQQLGIRESRLIVGRYVLQAEDLLTGRPFVDAIAAGSYPVDIHSPSDQTLVTQELEVDYYTIPYRSLLPLATANLLLAGRCISATHEACAAIRVSPIAMAIGEAAGVAAAKSVAQGKDPAEIDSAEIQRKLELPPFQQGEAGTQSVKRGISR